MCLLLLKVILEKQSSADGNITYFSHELKDSDKFASQKN